jgi:hypothetical protein
MLGGIKKIRRLNPEKVTQRDNISKKAVQWGENAKQRRQDVGGRKAGSEARKKELLNKLLNATEEEAVGMRMEIDVLD